MVILLGRAVVASIRIRSARRHRWYDRTCFSITLEVFAGIKTEAPGNADGTRLPALVLRAVGLDVFDNEELALARDP
jgi:hypothetical protein